MQKSGDARVALIGFPSVGKVTLNHNVFNPLSEELKRRPAVDPLKQMHAHSIRVRRLRIHNSHGEPENVSCHTLSHAPDIKAIPGVLEYQGARIQLLDLPGIVEGASQGRGRGRQVVSTAKTADLILIMLDATKSDEQRRLLEIELDAVGIRLNKMKPDVVFKRKTTGGVGQPFTATQLLRFSPTRTRLDHCK